MPELILYTNPMSRGRIARWMLEETGQPYRTELLDFGTTMKAPGYLAINPMGKVPAIRHGDMVITETAAICAYLADAFPATGLAPPLGDPLRGPYYRWLFFAAGPLEAAASNKALGFAVPAQREIMMGYGTMDTVLNTLEQALTQSEYLVGQNFSAADLYLGSSLGLLMEFGIIDKRPAFASYCDRIRARPASKRASEIDDALIAEAAKPKAE